MFHWTLVTPAEFTSSQMPIALRSVSRLVGDDAVALDSAPDSNPGSEANESARLRIAPARNPENPFNLA
jgi:hypothetical protein